MTTFTNISDEVLEPGKPIRSVDALAFRDNDLFLKDYIDVQSFDSSGTWTKPTSGGVVVGRLARIQVWGGGGGGARNTSTSGAAGGGGGGYNEITVPLSTLASSVTVTIGAGGAGRTGSTGNGTNGGDSSFGSVCTAYGGSGGQTDGGGGFGGGFVSAGTSSAYGLPWTNFDSNIGEFIKTDWHGGRSANATTLGNSPSITNVRFQSVWGGGGGGGATGSNFTIGGPSVFGGNGGAGGRSTENIDGVQPGGGGGGRNNNLDGGNGGAGRVIVTVW